MLFRVLLTGHKGYIGSSLFKALSLDETIHVVGYDMPDDLLNFTYLSQIFKEFKPHLVIHLAALSSVSECTKDYRKAFLINGQGTKNLIYLMELYGCSNIIYASTSSVYGQSFTPFSEVDDIEPCSIYGMSKLWGEFVIENEYLFQNKRGSYVIFRMFNVVGKSGYPDVDENTYPGNDRLFSALKSGNITIYGNNYPTYDGTCSRDYISLKDITRAYMIATKHIQQGNELRGIFNLCSNIAISVDTIVNLYNSLARVYNKSEVKYSYGPARVGDPKKVCGNNKLAQQVLKWHPKDNIDKIITDTFF